MSSSQSSIAPYSSSWSYTTSDTVTLKGASPSIGKAATGSPLVRAILESYGKEILESTSDQFLDLAVGVRLQTLSTRELVKLLARRKGLGIRRRISSTTKTVSVPPRTRMQVHGRSPTGSKSQSHGLRLPASDALPSKSLEPQIVRTQPKSGETSLS